MGLDFMKRVSVGLKNDPHWAYGGFMRFRIRVAKAIGIDLEKMKGFEGLFSDKTISYLDWPNKNPIEELLNHSDCDGELSAESCEEIAPILEGIIGGWGEDPTDQKNYDTIMGLCLVAAMRECAEERADLIFC